MKVKGNLSPKPLNIEHHPLHKGCVNVRLCENVVEIPTENHETTLYEYDEYSLVVAYYDGIQHDIESNLDNWFITAKTLEYNENASVVQDMIKALAILGVKTDEE